MTASEQRWKIEEEERIKKHEDKLKYWKDNPIIPFTEKEINSFLHRIVPTRFEIANKSQIDSKIWILTEPFFNNNGIFFWGKPGTGKTYLCAALIRDYYLRFPKKIRWYETSYPQGEKYAEYISPPDPVMVTVPDLFMDIKSRFGKPEGYAEGQTNEIGFRDMNDAQLIDYFCKTPILFLDDIGTEKTTDWAFQTLYTIIDRRYREFRQTVITSNLSLNELSDRTGDRITSRIAEMCNVIELKGKDRRLEKR